MKSLMRPESPIATRPESTYKSGKVVQTNGATSLEADIQSCFDKISHDWMIANIPTDKAVLKKWLKAGRAKLYRVWRRQDGMCSTCQSPITKSTPWGTRYIVKKREGGSDAASNLQLHHLYCHSGPYYAKNEAV